MCYVRGDVVIIPDSRLESISTHDEREDSVALEVHAFSIPSFRIVSGRASHACNTFASVIIQDIMSGRVEGRRDWLT